MLLFTTFTTKIVKFLYFFSSFLTKHVKNIRLLFQIFTLTWFLQIKIYSLVCILFYLIFLWHAFRSFVSKKFSIVKYLLKGVVNKLHFSNLIFNPLACDLSHKKRKDSLETLAEPVVYNLQLEFRNLLELILQEPAWNINKKVRGTIK